MTWFIFSICSVFALALAELVQQHLLCGSENIDERSSAILTFLFQALLTVPLIFALNLESEFLLILQPDYLPWLLGVALIGSCAMVLYLRSFKVQSISFSCIFISWSVVVSSILGIIFFAESVTTAKLVGLLLVMIAIMALNFRNMQLEKNHAYALMAGVLFGISYTIDKKIVLGIHPILYMFWIFLLVAVCGALYKVPGTFRAVKSLSRTDFRKIIISGSGYFIFNFCTFSAYVYGGEVGRVDAINNSQVFIIIAVEYFIFRQKTGLARKLVSALLAVLGVSILGIAR